MSSHCHFGSLQDRAVAIAALFRACIVMLLGVLLIAAVISRDARRLSAAHEISCATATSPQAPATLPMDGIARAGSICRPPDSSGSKPSGGEPGMVSVENRADNMARWVQHVHLNPGWYYVGAQVETHRPRFRPQQGWRDDQPDRPGGGRVDRSEGQQRLDDLVLLSESRRGRRRCSDRARDRLRRPDTTLVRLFSAERAWFRSTSRRRVRIR